MTGLDRHRGERMMICKNIHNDRSSAVQHMRQYQKDISLEHRLMIEMRLTLHPMVYADMKCMFHIHQFINHI